MKTIYASLLLFISSLAFGQYINIPDPNFRAVLLQKFPQCFNGAQQLDTTSIVGWGTDTLDASNMGITNVEGLQYISSIDYLDLSHNAITSLPANAAEGIFNSFMEINLSYNQLTELPDWFVNAFPITSDLSHNNFQNLDNFMIAIGPSRTNCSYNQLTTLPSNPRIWYTGAHTYFYCAHNNLTSIPSIYMGDSIQGLFLDVLSCGYNNISSLPTFYGRSLYCNNNPLIDLPDFIDPYQGTPQLYLDFINCSYTNISNLNKLQNVEYAAQLNCSHTSVSSIPILSLDQLNFSYCNVSSFHSNVYYSLNCKANPINCLPLLDNNLQVLQTDSTNITCLPNVPPGLSSNLPICSSISAGCEAFPYTSGHVFLDHNGNGVNDNNDYTIAQQIIKSTTNNWYSSSDNTGMYSMPTDTGISTVLLMPYPPSIYYTIVPATGYNVLYHSYGTMDSLKDFSLYPSPNKNDLETYMFASWLRPGFDGSFYVNVKNVGTTVQNITLKVKWDNTLQMISSLPSYQSISGDTIIYVFNNVQPLTNVNVNFLCHIDSTVPLGTTINLSAIAIGSVGVDETQQNNIAVPTINIVGSYDPNEITVSRTQLTPSEIGTERLVYTIRFQNTGTFFAENIKVVMKADAGLKPETIQMIGTSHPCQFELHQNGYIIFDFPNIMLPDSNSNETLSHGTIVFSVKPSGTLQLGNSIREKASIYFDFNQPVITNEVITTIVSVVSINELTEKKQGSWLVYPNPFTNQISIKGLQSLIRLEVIDQVGNKIVEVKGDLFQGQLDLSGLNKGLYFLRLVTDKGINVEKIIKY